MGKVPVLEPSGIVILGTVEATALLDEVKVKVRPPAGAGLLTSMVPTDGKVPETCLGKICTAYAYEGKSCGIPLAAVESGLVPATFAAEIL